MREMIPAKFHGHDYTKWHSQTKDSDMVNVPEKNPKFSDYNGLKRHAQNDIV